MFCGDADTKVSGSPSGSEKLPNAFAVYEAPCSTSISGGVSLCSGAWSSPPSSVSDTVALDVCPRPSEIS